MLCNCGSLISLGSCLVGCIELVWLNRDIHGSLARELCILRLHAGCARLARLMMILALLLCVAGAQGGRDCSRRSRGRRATFRRRRSRGPEQGTGVRDEDRRGGAAFHEDEVLCAGAAAAGSRERASKVRSNKS